MVLKVYKKNNSATRILFLFAALLFLGAGTVCAFDVTDALGRNLSFDKPPGRIVIAGRAVLAVADAVYMFPEAKEKVAAIEKITQGAENFIPLIDDNFDKKIILPVMAGAEEILAARPDVVLMKAYMRNKLGKPLEQLGVMVVYLNFESPAEYLKEVRTLGKILGSSARAEDIVSYYTSRLGMVEDAAVLPEQRKPSVLFLSYSDRGGSVTLNVPPESWLQARLIETAGGIPVWTKPSADRGSASRGWRKVGVEQIARWNPEYIVVTSYFSDVDKVTDRLYTDSVWQNLDAVKNNKLLGFPADFFSWDQPDTRWILGLMWLARSFHPGRLNEVDMKSELFTFYNMLYGLEKETVEEYIFPLLRGDLNGDTY